MPVHLHGVRRDDLGQGLVPLVQGTKERTMPVLIGDLQPPRADDPENVLLPAVPWQNGEAAQGPSPAPGALQSPRPPVATPPVATLGRMG